MHNNKKRFINILLREFIFSFLPRVLTLAFLILTMFGFDKPYLAILSLIAAAIHELGHIFCSVLLGLGGKIPTPFLKGMRIKYNKPVPYKSSILIILFGPLANLIAFFTSLPFFNSLAGYVYAFGFINLFCALSNLAPIDGNDGYGAIKLVLSYFNCSRGFIILDYVSLALTSTLTLLCIYTVYRADTGYWALCVFLAATVVKCGKMSEYGNL